uniref:Uncharacterized protein n=1 Tax=Acrobeloides nanus TaxID=290746 RepID=A0A914CUW6_9BILA
MYDSLTEAFRIANNDHETHLTVFTGAGDFFTSGNDWSQKEREKFVNQLEKNNSIPWVPYINELIKHKKPIIALVNGPAIGIGCIVLGLCDMVIASNNAYFNCPYVDLGIVPGCLATETFPKLIGHALSSRMLIFGETLTAQEALTAGLVSKVLSQEGFKEETSKLVQKYAQLHKESILVTKRLMRDEDVVQTMLDRNKKEEQILLELNREKAQERMVQRFLKAKF